MRYIFVGTKEDLFELGFKVSFLNYFTGEVWSYSKPLDIKRKKEVDVDLVISKEINKTTGTDYWWGISLAVNNNLIAKFPYIMGTNDDGEWVDCKTVKEYNQACFNEMFNIDALFELCKKGLIKEVEE